nr:hypothetical protein KitaXyl93_77400 [Kitasatospora sp. Xyl93]
MEVVRVGGVGVDGAVDVAGAGVDAVVAEPVLLVLVFAGEGGEDGVGVEVAAAPFQAVCSRRG